ncbi:GxxExxY protein, partial [bacterium]|nr:GxxExxY protein [bacterium]
HIEQILSYLKASNLKLGILANFGSKGVKIQRIINFQ